MRVEPMGILRRTFFNKIAGRQAARAAPRARAGGPGPAQRALTKISNPGTYLETGFLGLPQIRRNHGRALISRKSYVWLRSSVSKGRIGTYSGSIDSSRRARRAQHFVFSNGQYLLSLNASEIALSALDWGCN